MPGGAGIWYGVIQSGRARSPQFGGKIGSSVSGRPVGGRGGGRAVIVTGSRTGSPGEGSAGVGASSSPRGPAGSGTNKLTMGATTRVSVLTTEGDSGAGGAGGGDTFGAVIVTSGSTTGIGGANAVDGGCWPPSCCWSAAAVRLSLPEVPPPDHRFQKTQTSSRSAMNYFRRFFRIEAMYRFAAALPFTRRAGFAFRFALAFRRGAAFFVAFLRRFVDVARFAVPKACAIIVCTAGVC